jgi:hypothetical protein
MTQRAANSGPVLGLAARDLCADASSPQLAPVLVVVVAAVGEYSLGPTAWTSDAAAHRRHALDQRDELGYVVAVAARERPGERDPGGVDQKVVLGAVSGSINRAQARRAPLFSLARG